MATMKDTTKKPEYAGPEIGVGRRLRLLRGQRQLTISMLAKQTKVSSGMISQIERGLANPSIKTLERLRIALGIPLTALLEDGGETGELCAVRDMIRRVSQRPFLQVGKSGIYKELLSPSGDHDVQFMIITMPPHTQSQDVVIGPGEKAGLLLEGRLSLTLGGATEQLEPGDSFQFDSNTPHSVGNNFEESARLLWIMYSKPEQPPF